ncbi:MAG: hypothetical protein ACM3PA_01250 [Methanomassiliicoccales archaeon]
MYDHHERKGSPGNGVSGGVYGMAFIGAAVYYLHHATTFWGGALGLGKALIWPAMVIYNLLAFLKM